MSRSKLGTTGWTLPRRDRDPNEVARKCEALGIDPKLVMHPDLPLPNYEAVTHNTFVVRTQAGFRQALKAWGLAEKDDPIHEWPTAYPSLVTFTKGYAGYHYVQCSVVHLNTLMPVVAKHHA